MQLIQRGKYWWYRFTAPNGQRVFRSTRTTNKRLAQEYADKLKAELWRQTKLGEKPAYTWKDAVVRLLRETESPETKKYMLYHMRILDRWLSNAILTEIDRDFIDRIIAARLTDNVSNATVNRSLEVLRLVLKHAQDDWEWLDRIPKVKMFKATPKRIRWITKVEAERLCSELPEHLEAMARFSLATGLRESNVTRLEWSQIDLVRGFAWIYADQAKGGDDISVPLIPEAVAILRKQIGQHNRFVFAYRGKPVKKANGKAFRKALDRAGIENFRWHDLRHTWASWHIQNGTPIHVLKELGGWKSLKMVLRYAHLGAEHLVPYAGNISAPHQASGAKLVAVKN